VARKSQLDLIGGNAAPIIADADQPAPALLDIDRDGICPSIERVFDQFLDHRSGSLDDFSRRDLSRDDVR